MKVWLQRDGKSHAVTIPFDGADYVTTTDCCSQCGSQTIRGVDPTHDHDTYKSKALCANGHPRGYLFARVETIFGIEEDERVLNGRCRVYQGRCAIKSDGNTKAIVKELRRHGHPDLPRLTPGAVAAFNSATVPPSSMHAGMYSKGLPDLLCGINGRTYVLEVKNPDGRNRMTPSQVKWHADWRGEAPIVVASVAEALIAVGLVP